MWIKKAKPTTLKILFKKNESSMVWFLSSRNFENGMHNMGLESLALSVTFMWLKDEKLVHCFQLWLLAWGKKCYGMSNTVCLYLVIKSFLYIYTKALKQCMWKYITDSSFIKNKNYSFYWSWGFFMNLFYERIKSCID